MNVLVSYNLNDYMHVNVIYDKEIGPGHLRTSGDIILSNKLKVCEHIRSENQYPGNDLFPKTM
jgi:hypothetical protein